MAALQNSHGRAGTSGHQNLIEMACKKLLNELVGDKFLSITLVRENPLDVKTETKVEGERFGSYNVAMAEVRLYADIACAVLFDPNAKFHKDPLFPHLLPEADKELQEGNYAKYYDTIRTAYGIMIYLVECEINPNSNLLKDGPRLTAYKLIKQQNRNLMLILAVFEGTKVEHPEIFDVVWEFPKKDS